MAAAASKEAVAVWVSLFDLGDVEKNWVNLLPFADGLLGDISGFSLKYEVVCGALEGQVPANGLKVFRGMVSLEDALESLVHSQLYSITRLKKRNYYRSQGRSGESLPYGVEMSCSCGQCKVGRRSGRGFRALSIIITEDDESSRCEGDFW